MDPLAFHITFGTYGTRLHGDARGTVDRSMNKPGDPIIGADPLWWGQEQGRLNFSPIRFTREQMIYAESVIPSICQRGHWEYHSGAAGPDHIHTLLTPLRKRVEGEAVRKWLKRWLGEAMSERWALPSDPPGATWWAEGGSVKWVWKDDYFDNVRDYLNRQRATR